MTPAPRPRRPFWLRWLIRGTLALIVLIAIGISLTLYSAYVGRTELQQLLANTEAADPGWSLDAMEANPPAIPNDHNGAAFIIRFKPPPSPQPFASNDDADLFGNELGPPNRLNAAQRAALDRAFVGDAQRRIEARTLAELPVCRHTINWGPNPIAVVIPSQINRAMAHYLQADLLDLIDRGDRDGGVRSWRALWNCNRSIGDEPTLIAVLIRVAVRAVSLRSLERMLAQHEWTDYQLAVLQAELQAEEGVDQFRIGIRGERALSDRTFQFLQSSTPNWGAALGMPAASASWEERLLSKLTLFPGFMERQRAASLRNLNEAVAITKLPEQEQLAALAAWEGKANTLPILAKLMTPAVAKVGTAIRRDRAGLRSAMAAVAVERFRVRTGQFPTTLDEVVAAKLLPAVPLDPYTATPLKLAVRRGVVVIYAVGKDGVDDGGIIDWNRSDQPGTDIGFRLWPPALRRQPAAPPPLPKPAEDMP